MIYLLKIMIFHSYVKWSLPRMDGECSFQKHVTIIIVHTPLYIYVYMYICICVYRYIRIYVYMFICLYVLYMYICICVYMYICIYVYMFICMYIYICIYIYSCIICPLEFPKLFQSFSSQKFSGFPGHALRMVLQVLDVLCIQGLSVD